MRCTACDAPLDPRDVFPGGAIRCACGVENDVPGAPPEPPAPTSLGPYREAQSVRDASMLACPYCGAPCSPDVRACPHCDVELASVRCAHCFTLHFTGARFCARCGRELELEALLDATDAPCPRCGKPLCTAATDGMSECTHCGGLFVDHGAFAAITAESSAARSRGSYEGTHEVHPSTPLTGANAVVRYVKCPVCSEMMNRVNFGKRSGVIVDTCKLHGIWFDAGELTRVVEFVAVGGLDEARRREREEAESAQTKATRVSAAFHVEAMQVAARTPGMSRGLASSDSLLDVILAFLRAWLD